MWIKIIWYLSHIKKQFKFSELSQLNISETNQIFCELINNAYQADKTKESYNVYIEKYNYTILS